MFLFKNCDSLVNTDEWRALSWSEYQSIDKARFSGRFRSRSVPMLPQDVVFSRSDPGHDLTLECADGAKVKAHKIALATVSPIFEDMFHATDGEVMKVQASERYIFFSSF